MKIASWNVNSIRARIDNVCDWLREAEPDVLCLQETKVIDDDFPSEPLQRLGYSVTMAGQPTYNGVALVSRHPTTDVRVGFPGSADEEKRLIGARIGDLLIYSAYVPNGKMVDSEAFHYKLNWLEQLRQLIAEQREEPLLICGDFNIARQALDVFDVERMQGQLHFHPKEHAAFDRLLAAGSVDLFRELHPETQAFSWWDYRAGAFRRNRGLRIDYILGTPSIVARVKTIAIDKGPRSKPKPSDHTPVVVELGERP